MNDATSNDIRHSTVATTIGDLTLVAAGSALIGVYFPGHWVGIARANAGAEVIAETDPVLSVAAGQLREYLAGERTGFTVPIEAQGAAFDQAIWAMLRDIPFGETVTYGELADRLGNRGLSRRVGQAVGFNPVSIFIPCHRVVGKGGKITGYAGGIERKKFLLTLEEPVAASAGRLF